MASAAIRTQSSTPRDAASPLDWWERPNADFAAEAGRMRARDCSEVTNLIGWKAVGTSLTVRWISRVPWGDKGVDA